MDEQEEAVFLTSFPGSAGGHVRKLNYTSSTNNNHGHFIDAYSGNSEMGGYSHDGTYAQPLPQQQQRYFFQSVFSASGYSGEGQENDPAFGHAHLFPPSQYTGEMGRRKSSNASLDSYTNSRRRGSHMGSSASRLYDVLDEDSREVATLMTYMRGIGYVVKRTRKALRTALQIVFMARPSRPKLVCEAEVMDQVGWVCKDYIVARLVVRDLMSRKTGITPSNWPKSRHVIAAGAALEALYPRTYSNVSRKLCLTMSSPKVVRNTLMAILEVLFERTITWAKVVSMMAIAGLYAEECTSQGHPDFVHEVVDVVLDFTGGHLLPWLVSQGGWDGFPLPEGSEGNRLSMFRLLLVTGMAISIVVARYYLPSYSSHRPDENLT
ncbi:Bcl-2-related ovarian killer protein homolog b-like [Plakobranchus ocellatus]|uniref:Bcl-2-related ovarian killer protein homolog b-like n=1 Tax=Plakobranchus ocellatus TaxID=259542 RepID=A0AAV4AND8_9GAST|nr:Bcl-2-related ovarian killer protein homolog b-like [Plakobranchus ocellatus]